MPNRPIPIRRCRGGIGRTQRLARCGIGHCAGIIATLAISRRLSSRCKPLETISFATVFERRQVETAQRCILAESASLKLALQQSEEGQLCPPARSLSATPRRST